MLWVVTARVVTTVENEHPVGYISDNTSKHNAMDSLVVSAYLYLRVGFVWGECYLPTPPDIDSSTLYSLYRS